MKKLTILFSVFLSTVFLAGCNQTPVEPLPSKSQETQSLQTEQPTETEQSTETEPSTETQTEEQTYVEVAELSFKLPIDEDEAKDITYTIKTSDTIKRAVFSSKTLNALNANCGDGTSGPTISKIKGTPSNPESGDADFYKAQAANTRQFNGYFLFYQTPQSSCTDGKNVDQENKVAKTISKAFKKVKEI